MEGLAQDYQLWATSAVDRAQREAASAKETAMIDAANAARPSPEE